MDFNKEKAKLILDLLTKSFKSIKYEGDLSDCGNEIGIVLAMVYPDLINNDIEDLFHGIRHGIYTKQK